MKERKVLIWQKTDIDGFFGLVTNNLTNLLVMAGLLLSVGIPANITFGKILPAVGLAIFISSMIYSIMAYKLAKQEGRNDVTSLPSGTSVPHMFLIVYVIMGPIYHKTGDPYIAWYASLAWGFLEGVVELLGSFFGETLRRIIPRPAMLGSLAGVSITYIAMNPAMRIFDLPYIGLVCFAIVLLGWYGKIKMPLNLPIGLIAIILGTVVGWVTGNVNIGAVSELLKSMTISFPDFSIQRIVQGFTEVAPFLLLSIPLGIYNTFETIDNIESASAARDKYSTFWTMIADGATSIIGSLFGSPFPTAVFIGHPGWKEVGARIGYTIATGTFLLVIVCSGLISVFFSAIQIQAILPILVYIGLVIGSQAFQESDKKYAPAIILAIIPWLADWGKNIIDSSLSVANLSVESVGIDTLISGGVEINGMAALGSGSILISMIWASILCFIIDNHWRKASVTAVVAGILSFFGIIHTANLGFNEGGEMSISYFVIAIMFFAIQLKNNKYFGGNKYDTL